jgi:cytoskeletal protein RodZ
MQAIGERLREARMRQGLDITDVEAATKIRGKYLRALEDDEFAMLPGGTYVKSFLRTYAEHLGLDAHLLVEEYRVQHEPRGQSEIQAFAPPAGRAPDTRDRRPARPPGPLAVLLLAVIALLVVFAVIGLVSGGDSKTGKTTKPAAAAPKKKARRRHAKARARTPAPAAVARSVKLKVIPVETTYVCVDDGHGAKVFEGTISKSQSFRRRTLRVTLGRSSARLYVNGKPVRFARGSASVGLALSRTGSARALPPTQRPCA